MADLNFTFGADGTDLNREIEKARKAIQELGLEQLKLQTGADGFSMAAIKAMTEVTQESKKTKDSFDNLDKSVAQLKDQLVSLYAVKQLINWMDWANNIDQTAKAVGLTTGEMLALQTAVMQAGGTAQAASRGIEMFYMKLDQARQGGLMQQEAFKRIGISLEDLAKYDDQALFKKTIEALSAMPASAERNRIEVELLSRSFRGIPLPEINAQLDKTKGSFDAFGPVLEDAGKAYRMLEQDIQNFKLAILSILQPITQAFGSGAVSVRQFQIALEGILAVLTLMGLARIPVLLLAIGEAFITIAKAVETATIALRAFSVAEALAVNATGLGALLNVAGKLAAGALALGVTWLGLDAIMQKANETNKESAAISKEKADADKKLQNSQTFDATAKMTAMITEQTKAFKENIQAQIDNIKSRTSTIGMGEEEKAQMDEELRVRDEFRRKIEELNVKLAEAKAAGPAQEIYFQQDALKKSIDDLTKSEEGYIKAAGNAASVKARENSADQMALLLKEDQIKINKTIADIQVTMDELTMTTDQKKIANVQKQTNEYIKLATEKRRAQLGVNVSDEELAQDAALQKIIAGIKEKQQETTAATEKEIEASREWSTGWTQAFKQYVEDATNSANEAKRVFEVATKGMEDMLVNFFHTGKLGWQSFLQTVVDELLRSQIRQLMAKTFGGISGGASLLGFADGGVIPTNGPVLVGERGPEIISGAKGMNVTPNGALGGNSVTYNINAVDAMSFKQMLAADPTFLYAVSEQGRRRVPGG